MEQVTQSEALTHPPPRIAYLTNQYPSVSHTFIRREILGLEALGYEILRLAIRRGARVVDPADEAEAEKTYHCLERSPFSLLLSAGLVLLGQPLGALGALRMTLSMSRRSDRGLLRHLAYLVEAAALLRMVRGECVEHIHVHFGTNAAAVARLMQRLGGPSYSMTIHGPDELDAPVGLSLGEKMAEAAFTVAITDYCSAQLRRWVGYEHWLRIRIVHCTVAADWFEAAGPVAEDSRSLVCVGRLSAQKGQLLLVEAFARVHREVPGARLVLVGDGEMRSEVEARIAASGLGDAVTITGWQDEAQVRAHLLGCRALVLGSFAEGLPVVIMEAMALARPVISTYISGIPELVRPGTDGWLVVSGNVDALAGAMKAAFEAPVAALDGMGRAGQARVRARHSVATEVAKLDRLFREAAGCGGKEPKT